MLENEINFEFNNLEQKLLKLLEEYNQLKNKVKKLSKILKNANYFFTFFYFSIYNFWIWAIFL